MKTCTLLRPFINLQKPRNGTTTSRCDVRTSQQNTYTIKMETSNNRSLNTSGIEYDDDAIFSENPNLEEHIKRFETSQYEWSPLLQGLVMRRSSADKVTTKRHQLAVERMTTTILESMRPDKKRIMAAEQKLKECRAAVKELKSDFSRLQVEAAKVEKLHGKVIRNLKAERNNLELIVYQNSVIRFLRIAAKNSKVYHCYVSPERQIYFYDPNHPGTDVDAAYVQHSVRSLERGDAPADDIEAMESPL